MHLPQKSFAQDFRIPVAFRSALDKRGHLGSLERGCKCNWGTGRWLALSTQPSLVPSHRWGQLHADCETENWGKWKQMSKRLLFHTGWLASFSSDQFSHYFPCSSAKWNKEEREYKGEERGRERRKRMVVGRQATVMQEEGVRHQGPVSQNRITENPLKSRTRKKRLSAVIQPTP